MSGTRLELELSRGFHAVGVPLLVSPTLLRSRDLGQIDLARVVRKKESWTVELAEVKSSSTGIEVCLRGQRKRILEAGRFLGSLFGAPIKFISLVGKSSGESPTL